MTTVSIPLIGLDVDGVINDEEALQSSRKLLRQLDSIGAELPIELELKTRPWTVNLVEASGSGGTYILHVPDYMGRLIRKLVNKNEVMWLSTWGDDANNELRVHLNIPELDAVEDDGSYWWKITQFAPYAQKALQQGREVYWIEDFGSEKKLIEEQLSKHNLEKIQLIDTTRTMAGRYDKGVLREEHVTHLI